MRYTTYLTANGMINSRGIAAEGDVIGTWGSADVGVVEALDQTNGDDPARFYVEAGAVVPRPESPCTLSKATIATDGADKAVIANIPSGARCVIYDIHGRHEYTVTDGLVEITADEAGGIAVEVSTWPHLDYSAKVTAQ